ncbi:hypothetical protein EWM64_g4292 [Hericium alpestre]|uniref:Uncharacterized protein n=1 Tax=Hericium alpestre TaxID=135208 RepID=A0A4Y9ZY38_9AGAM|nr:hypothetical protein EWM64_g4292 [Hericium alpestre]
MSAPEDVTMEEPAPSTQQAEAQPPLTKLQSQIDALTEFSARLQKLRQLPPLLLRPESDPIGSSLPDVLRRALLEAHGARTTLLEETVQGALKAAAESESRDRVGIRGNARRDRRRRKRSPTPESPRPFPAFRPKTTSLFPSTSTGSSLTLSQLPEYIRTFNAAHAKKAALHIWLSSSRDSRDLRVPVVIRFLIPDVLRVFITVGHADGENDTPAEDRPLLIENITAFGTRERVSVIWTPQQTSTLAIRLSSISKAIAADPTDASVNASCARPNANVS